jgi:CubicO group peptidase (beta-lactamase class C family)
LFVASQIEELVQGCLEAHGIPGLAVGVVSQGALRYARGFGVETPFRIGSVSKPLVGTAIMRLVESGALGLDVPVERYVPWLRLSREATVTLRMLLSHTAGLPALPPYAMGPSRATIEAYVREEFPQLPLVAEPGAVFLYSNPGLVLAGHIAEVASGRPFDDLVRGLVLEPLGMTETHFDLPENPGIRPAAGAVSTVSDLARFALMQMGGGGQILSPASVDLMQSEQVSRYTMDGAGYGLTFFRRSYKGLQLIGHEGKIGTFGSILDMAPEAGAAVILLANQIDSPYLLRPLAQRILDSLLGLPTDVKPVAVAVPDRSVWPGFVGTYIHPTDGLATVAVSEDGHHLTADLGHGPFPLAAHSQRTYFANGPRGCVSLGFVPSRAAGPAPFLMVDGEARARFPFDPAFQLSPAAVSPFVGTYTFAPVADARVTLRLEGSQLWANFPWMAEQEVLCRPLNTNTQFVCSQGIFTLERGDDGRARFQMNGWVGHME